MSPVSTSMSPLAFTVSAAALFCKILTGWSVVVPMFIPLLFLCWTIEVTVEPAVELNFISEYSLEPFEPVFDKFNLTVPFASFLLTVTSPLASIPITEVDEPVPPVDAPLVCT